MFRWLAISLWFGTALAADTAPDLSSVIEKVRGFIVADEPFTVENAMLTPSIKIRRHVIKEAYGERLDGLYKR